MSVHQLFQPFLYSKLRHQIRIKSPYFFSCRVPASHGRLHVICNSDNRFAYYINSVKIIITENFALLRERFSPPASSYSVCICIVFQKLTVNFVNFQKSRLNKSHYRIVAESFCCQVHKRYNQCHSRMMEHLAFLVDKCRDSPVVKCSAKDCSQPLHVVAYYGDVRVSVPSVPYQLKDVCSCTLSLFVCISCLSQNNFVFLRRCRAPYGSRRTAFNGINHNINVLLRCCRFYLPDNIPRQRKNIFSVILNYESGIGSILIRLLLVIHYYVNAFRRLCNSGYYLKISSCECIKSVYPNPCSRSNGRSPHSITVESNVVLRVKISALCFLFICIVNLKNIPYLVFKICAVIKALPRFFQHFTGHIVSLKLRNHAVHQRYEGVFFAHALIHFQAAVFLLLRYYLHKQHVPPIFIYEFRNLNSQFSDGLVSQTVEVQYSKVHGSLDSKIKKGIPFRLRRKLVRHNQNSIAFFLLYFFKNEFFLVNAFASAINIKHVFLFTDLPLIAVLIL